jgi:lysozyme
MRISESGIDLIKRFEGLELESYQDIAGVWTIGYGHTETAGPNQKISAREADDLLRRDLAPRERAVEQMVKVPLNQNEFDALVSFVFNVGIGALKSSTALKRLNRNDRLGAADALTWWNKATVAGVLREVTGLTRRRASERALFLTPTNPPIVNKPDNVSENSRVTPVEEAPRRENLGESRTIQGAAVAGGAGAAASTIGKNSAKDLDQLEKNIEQGTGLTEKPPGEGGIGDTTVAGPSEPPATGGAPGGADTGGGNNPSAEAPSTAPDGTTQTIGASPDRPAAREKNAVDAQLQFALLIIIVLAALYIVFARVDDWFKYRR